MIKRIFSGITERLSEKYCGRKIAFFCKAYGAEYDFCRFYSAESGIIMIYNSNMTADISDDDEAAEFIAMNSPATAEMNDTSCEISGMKKSVCGFMVKKSGAARKVPDDVMMNGSFDDMYRIVEKCFPGTDHGLWYTHISHCVRHGLTDTFLIKDTASLRADDHGEYVYLSETAVVPDKRGMGYCRRITGAAEGYYGGKTLALCASGKNAALYRHLGFESAGEFSYYVKG